MNQSTSNDIRDIRVNSPEKDLVISQLKSQIFELEQNEKNFSSLHNKFRSLQSDYTLLSQEKLRLEYDLKQRTDSLNKQVAELRNENENLQVTLNDKLALNKKLYNDNNKFFLTFESKNAENEALREQIAELEEFNAKLNDDKASMDKIINNLTQTKQAHENSLNKCHSEIERLTKISDDQTVLIKNLNSEKVDMLNRIDELNFELKNSSEKLRNRENNLNQSQRQIEDLNKNITSLDMQNSDLEENLKKVKNDLSNVNNAYSKERANRAELEKNNDKLENLLSIKVGEIKRITNDLEKQRDLSEKLTSEKAKLLGESERFRNHIYVLTEQNQNVR